MQIEGGKVEAVTNFFFLGSKTTVDGDCSQEIRRWLLLGRKAMTNLVCWKAETSLCQRRSISQGYGLPSSHIWLWELDRKEGRAPGNRCLRTVVLEKILENPLDSKEIKPVNLKGNQPWILNWKYWCWSWSSSIWSPDANSWLIGKVPDAGKDWEQKEKTMAEDEMDGWHHWYNGHALGQTMGDCER